MTIEETYLQFLELVNKNNTNNNVAVDKPRFVMLYNNEQIKHQQSILNKRNEDEIRTIQNFLVVNKTLTGKTEKETYTKFELPEDYFELASLKVTAKKGSCTNKRLSTFEIKSEDEEEITADSSNAPSFEWRETPYYLASSTVTIFKTDFEIQKAEMTYYRYPRKVAMSGVIDLHTNLETTLNIDPEQDEKLIIKILQGMARDFAANNADFEKWQLENARANSN